MNILPEWLVLALVDIDNDFQYKAKPTQDGDEEVDFATEDECRLLRLQQILERELEEINEQFESFGDGDYDLAEVHTQADQLNSRITVVAGLVWNSIRERLELFGLHVYIREGFKIVLNNEEVPIDGIDDDDDIIVAILSTNSLFTDQANMN